VISIRVVPAVRDAVAKLAAAERRTVSSMLEILVEQAIEQRRKRKG
jgi:hypothetical protein